MSNSPEDEFLCLEIKIGFIKMDEAVFIFFHYNLYATNSTLHFKTTAQGRGGSGRVRAGVN